MIVGGSSCDKGAARIAPEAEDRGRDPDRLVDGYELVTVSRDGANFGPDPTIVARRAAEPMLRRTRFRACPSA
jgi:hypothetical protein